MFIIPGTAKLKTGVGDPFLLHLVNINRMEANQRTEIFRCAHIGHKLGFLLGGIAVLFVQRRILFQQRQN